MPQSTTSQSRLGILTPDLDYDTVIDGGTALKAAVDAAFAKCGNNMVGRWSNDIILANGATTTYTHSFGQALTQLKVLVFVSNALISKATQDAQLTITQSTTNIISINNISGGSLTFQLYVLAFPLSVRTADIDASIDAVIARLEFTAGILLDEMATPSTPSSGKVAVYAKTDKNLYVKDSNGTEKQVGSGSGGGINYISNGDFENGAVTGWAVYADAAGTVPVDGTGGSPTTSFASSSSSPPRGTYCGLLTKDAANRQGEGASYAFTISPADVSRTMQLTFDSVASANFVDSDLNVFIYDVTNGVLITPSANHLPTGTSSQKSYAFNTSTSLSYRLIFHVSSTSALAYTVKLDQISLGPIIRPIINGNSDMGNSWTPTSSWSANTTHTGKWAREGDMMRGQILLALAGAPTSATLTNVALPSGYVIDTTKLINPVAGVAIPYCSCTVKSAGAVYTSSPVWFVDTTTLKPTYDNGSGIATAITQAAPGTFANGDYVQIDFLVPIVSWSSGITLSSTNAVTEFVYNSSGTTAAGASDTTSFGYGAVGALVGSIASTTVTSNSATTMRVRFQTAMQPTDRIVMEVNNGTAANGWVPVAGSVAIQPALYQGAAAFGVGLIQVNSTDLDVSFGNGGRLATNATFASAGSAWSGVSTYRWRVAKYSAIGGAEIAPATAISAGTVSGGTVPGAINGSSPATGYVGEQLKSTISSGSVPATGTYGNATSLTLTAGVWDVSASAVIFANGATATSFTEIGISTVATPTSFSDQVAGDNDFLFSSASGTGFTKYASGSIPKYRVAISSTTTYYLKTYIDNYNTATPTYWAASLKATRVG